MITHTQNRAETAQQGLEFLKSHISEIDTVEDWAMASGWKDVKYFSRFIYRYSGKSPSKIIIQTKVGLAISLLGNSPEKSCFEIALAIGKPDDKALNKFMKRHTENPPTFYRNHKNRIQFNNEQDNT